MTSVILPENAARPELARALFAAGHVEVMVRALQKRLNVD